jgi:hypothetical protein
MSGKITHASLQEGSGKYGGVEFTYNCLVVVIHEN